MYDVRFFTPGGGLNPSFPPNAVDASADDVSFILCLLSLDPLAHPHTETTGFHANSSSFCGENGCYLFTDAPGAAVTIYVASVRFLNCEVLYWCNKIDIDSKN